jgi:hypothetical protein
MKLLLNLLLLLPLGGCVSSLVYKEPDSGARARVRFVSELDGITVVRVYDDANCTTNENEWMRLKNGWLLNNHPKRLGMPLWNYHENAAKEVYVDSSKPFNSLISGGEPGGVVYSCGVPVAHSFKEGADYEVFYHWSRTACKVSIFELIATGSAFRKQEVASFTNEANENNQGCVNAFKKPRRLY